MKLINQKRASAIALTFTIAILALSALLLLAYFGNIQLLLQYIIPLWIALGVAILLYRFGGYHYMDIEITSHEADIKYYRIFPVGRQYKRVKIKGSQLHKIHVNNGFLGIGANLHLFVNTKKGKAKYPFIGLAAISPSDRYKIADALMKTK